MADYQHVLIYLGGAIALEEGREVTIGRGDHADLRVRSDSAISRIHVSATPIAGGGLMVRDQGSKNGFAKNRTMLPPGSVATLNDGDVLHIGGYEYHYRWVPETLDISRVREQLGVGRGETLEVNQIADDQASTVTPIPTTHELEIAGDPEKLAIAMEWALSFRRSGMFYIGEYWHISIRNGHINGITEAPIVRKKYPHLARNIAEAIADVHEDIRTVEVEECPQEDLNYSGPSLMAIAEQLRAIRATPSTTREESDARWKQVLEAHPYVRAWKHISPYHEANADGEPYEGRGGDFIEVATAYDGSFLALIGDATGHGVAAESIADQARNAFRILVNRVTSMRELTDSLMRELRKDADTQTGIFGVYTIVRIDSSGKTTIIQAGTNTVITIDAIENRVITRPPGVVACPIMMVNAKNCDATVALPVTDHKLPSYMQESGDKIIVLTDGITEATYNRDDQSEDQFESHTPLVVKEHLAASVDDLGTALLHAWEKYVAGNQKDDATIVVFEYRGH